ncbi:MAG: LuxR C-terminal-related transcriptional regulator [Anaerolineae bacterium]
MVTALLATKVHVPPLRPDFVPRRRLLDSLEEGLQRKLTLVSAPAGYGKTTLLSEWHASRRRQELALAWVLADEQDNDPVRFWSYVLAAVDSAWAGTAESARALLHALPSPGAAAARDTGSVLRGMLTAFVNDLASVQADDPAGSSLALVLDDYHTIHARGVHDSLAFFLEYVPSQVHVYILTRADPPLALARLRARDQLVELRAADLRFTAGEVELFLSQVMDLDLAASAVSSLDARTEGWVAGLQLAGLSLQGLAPEQAQRFLDTFAGTHRHVLGYLTEEVLQRQSPEVQAFLLQTAILPYLTASLCDAVMDQSGSQAMLERLVSDNLFTTPLDPHGQWYRYHPLFAETLVSQLQEASPDLVSLAHGRASAWHEKQGNLADAIRHALAGEHLVEAARLVEAAYKRMVMRGELVTLHHWLDVLPPHLIETRPRLGLASALALAYAGSRDEVEGYLQRAEEALNATVPAADAVRGEIAALRAVVSSVHWAGGCSIDLAQRALQLLPAARSEEDLWLRVLVLQAQGNCHRFQGEVVEAEESYAEALAVTQALNSPFLLQAVTNRRGQNQILQGRLRQAARTFQGALCRAEELGGELLWFSAELHAHLARIYTEWDDLEQAMQHARQGMQLSHQAENHLALLEGCLAQAGVWAARGELEAACSSLDQAQQLAAESGVPYLEAQVAVEGAWLGLASPPGATATTGVANSGGPLATAFTDVPDVELPVVMRERQDLIRARSWLTQGRSDEALSLLREIESAAQDAGRMGSVLQSLLLRALACQQLGDLAQARDSLTRALILAQPEGYVRSFVNAGEPLRFLLRDLQLRLPASEDAPELLPGYVVHLLAAFRGQDGPRFRTPDLLTPREQEILALMADGASNQEIAERLVVTVGTVKGHVNHILNKLGAHNRTGAVARARELGLLAH